MKFTLLFIMLFCHIVDDYYLQGWLASAKKKSWWEKNSPEKMYSKDYIMALCEHAFSWTFMIMLPPMIYSYCNSTFSFAVYGSCFFLNWVIHSVVDNLKANVKAINLIQDQAIHFAQILMTWTIFISMK